MSGLTGAGQRGARFRIGRWLGPGLRRDGDVLIGREPECAAIDRVLRDATDGESSSLVIRGEPGIGKSALLARAEHAAADSIVLRTAGQEAESDLAFAGLYGLLRPVAHRLSGLPEASGGRARECPRSGRASARARSVPGRRGDAQSARGGRR